MEYTTQTSSLFVESAAGGGQGALISSAGDADGGSAESVVDATSLGLLQRGVTTSVAEFITLTDSYHVATLDYDAQLIFDRSADFLTQHLGSPR